MYCPFHPYLTIVCEVHSGTCTEEMKMSSVHCNCKWINSFLVAFRNFVIVRHANVNYDYVI